MKTLSQQLLQLNNDLDSVGTKLNGLTWQRIERCMKEYALEACKETQKRCADKALMVDQDVKVYTRNWKGLKIYEQSILSEDNIPKELI